MAIVTGSVNNGRPLFENVEAWTCTGEEYHADPAIGQSTLKAYLTDPELYHDRQQGLFPPKTAKYFDFGKEFERLLFFGEVPGHLIPQEVLSRREKDGKVSWVRSGERYRAWEAEMRDQHGDDVLLLKEQEWQERVFPLLTARDKLRGHDRANKLVFGNGVVHPAFRWRCPWTGLELKCQLDVLHGPDGDPRIIVDVKTAASVLRHKFFWAVEDFGYHIQAWWYREAVFGYYGRRLPVVFVTVKNSPAYNCECFELPPEWYDLAAAEVPRGMERLASAMESGDFHTPTHGRIIMIDPPRRRRR